MAMVMELKLIVYLFIAVIMPKGILLSIPSFGFNNKSRGEPYSAPAIYYAVLFKRVKIVLSSIFYFLSSKMQSACAAAPSLLPVKPSLSSVVAFTLI